MSAAVGVVEQPFRLAGGRFVDMPVLGAGQNLQFLRWNNGAGTLEAAAAYTSAETDAALAASVAAHAAAADPHAPYLRADGTRAGASSQAQTLTGGIITGAAGKVGIGRTPGVPMLDILAPSGPAMRMASSTADNTPKEALITIAPYSNEQADILLFRGNASLDTSVPIYFGGGHASYGSAANIFFFTSPSSLTLSGTRRMLIAGDGKITLGSHSGTGQLDIGSGTSTAAQVNWQTSTAPSAPVSGNMWRAGDNIVSQGPLQSMTGFVGPYLRPASDGTSALKLTDTAGNTLIGGNTTNLCVGIGVSTPTLARLQIAANTTSRASLLLTPGASEQTSGHSDGGIWYATGSRPKLYRGSTTETIATGVPVSGAAATAGGTYGATEQAMLQAVYDAALAFGELTG